MYSRGYQWLNRDIQRGGYLGGHHTARCTRSGGCPRRAPLARVSCELAWHVRLRTIDVDIARLHELAELGEPLGCVNLGHVDGTEGGRRMECSGGKSCRSSDYMCCDSRVCTPPKARDHVVGTCPTCKSAPQYSRGSKRAKRTKHQQPRQALHTSRYSYTCADCSPSLCLTRCKGGVAIHVQGERDSNSALANILSLHSDQQLFRGEEHASLPVTS
jgi:hypothetical protein